MENFGLYSSVLVAFAAVCYYNSLECGFVFDDMSAIVNNKDLLPHKPISNLLWNDFWGTPMHMEKSHKSYRPLCVLTFRMNYLFSEIEPMSYHLVNLLLHGVVCILFMKVCNMFLKPTPSFLAALLFTVHPIHTEAITGVVGRAEALSSIFYLAALMTYSKSTNAKGGTAWMPLIGTVVLVMVAMLCKEQGITVIGVCCVYEVFVAKKASFAKLLNIVTSFLRGKPVVPKWLKGSIIRAGFLVGSTLFLLFARIKVMGAQLPVFTEFDNPSSMASTPSRQLTYNYLLAINAGLLLLPSNLCCDWTMGTIPVLNGILDYRNVFTVIFYGVMFKLGMYSLRCQNARNRALIMSLSLLVLPFIPASNLFFPVGFVVAERILYAPSMGFCMLFALGFDLLLQHKQKLKPVLWFFMGFLILIHATKTIVRNADWKTEYSLFNAALKVNQRNAKLFNNVGHALEKKSLFSEALEYFTKASIVQPDDIGALMNVGRTYNTLNQTVESEAAYRKAMELFPSIIKGKSYTARIAPQHLNLFLNLASLISKNESRLMEADELLRSAITMRPDYIKGYINRGDIMVRLGRLQDAIDQYTTALIYDSEEADVHYNLGVVNLEMKKKTEARKHFEDALRCDPNHEQALYNSAILIQEFGNPKELDLATKRLEKLTAKDFKDSRSFFTLGMIAMDQHDFERAFIHFDKAIEIEDDFRSALFNMALMLNNNMDRPLDALPYLEKLLKYYPDHTKGLLLMGDVNVNVLKDYDLAAMNFGRILELEPENTQAMHNLCVVYVEKGELVAAEKCLTNVHNMAPDEQYITRHLNIVRNRLNEIIRARQEKDGSGQTEHSAEQTEHEQTEQKKTEQKTTEQQQQPGEQQEPTMQQKPAEQQKPEQQKPTGQQQKPTMQQKPAEQQQKSEQKPTMQQKQDQQKPEQQKPAGQQQKPEQKTTEQQQQPGEQQEPTMQQKPAEQQKPEQQKPTGQQQKPTMQQKPAEQQQKSEQKPTMQQKQDQQKPEQQKPAGQQQKPEQKTTEQQQQPGEQQEPTMQQKPAEQQKPEQQKPTGQQQKPTMQQKPAEQQQKSEQKPTMQQKQDQQKPEQQKPAGQQQKPEQKPTMQQKPAEQQQKPEQQKPTMQQKPEQQKPTGQQQKPTMQQKPDQQKPAEQQQKPEQQKPTMQQKPEQQKPTGQQQKPTMQQKPDQQKPAEQQQKPEQQKPTMQQKPEQQKPAEQQKPEQQKSTGQQQKPTMQQKPAEQQQKSEQKPTMQQKQDQQKPAGQQQKPTMQQKPAEQQQKPTMQQKPEQQKPTMQQKPDQQKPAEQQQKPEQQKPTMQQKPEQQKPTMQQKPEQQKPTGQQQKPTMQQKPDQQKPEQQKPEQQKPTMQKPEQKPTMHQKPEQQKPEQQKPTMQQKPEQQKPTMQQKPEQQKSTGHHKPAEQQQKPEQQKPTGQQQKPAGHRQKPTGQQKPT